MTVENHFHCPRCGMILHDHVKADNDEIIGACMRCREGVALMGNSLVLWGKAEVDAEGWIVVK